jgi:hypothetical protein
MIKKTKGIEIGEIHFYNTFDSNVFLALKIMNFEDVIFKKLYIFM